MANSIAPGGALDKLKTGKYDPAFEKFYRGQSKWQLFKNMAYMVYCCHQNQLESHQTTLDDHETRITTLEP